MRNLAAVPALPTFMEAFFLGISPPFPWITTVQFSLSISVLNPNSSNAFIKCSASSLNCTPSSLVSPSAIAAMRRALFVILLEPGTSTFMSSGIFIVLTL